MQVFQYFLQMIVGTKSQLKTIVIRDWQFWILGQICPKRVFWIFLVKKGKSEHNQWTLHIRISLGTIFQLKLTFLMFWTKFAQKRYLQSETEKLHLRVSPWLLLIILNFSARVSQTQRFFNASSPSICRDI